MVYVHRREGSQKVFPELDTIDTSRQGANANPSDEERDVCSPLPSEPALNQPTKKRSLSSNEIELSQNTVQGSGNSLKKQHSAPSLGKVHRSRSSFSLAERLSFSFMNDIITDGKRRDILVGEYPPVEAVDDCQHLGRTFLAMWQKEKQLGNPKLSKVLYKMFGGNYFIAGVPYLLESVLKITQSYLLGMLLDWFQKTDGTDEWKGYTIATGLVLAVAGHSLLNQIKFFMTTRIGMQVRVSLVSAIYSKTLQLPLSAHISSGQIQSFINSDVQRFEDASGFAHYLWLGPLETLIATYFIYSHIGVAAFAAIGILLLLIPLQSSFARMLLKYRKGTNQSQDARNKSLSEMIAGMVMIKLYSWEIPLMDKVRDIRRKELQSIKKAAIVRAFNEALFFSSSATVAVFAFGTYYWLGGQLTAAKVFATATYLQTIRMTMTNLFAKGFQMSSECILACRRIESYFSMPDIAKPTQEGPDPLIATLNDPALFVCIKDGSFSWKSTSKDEAFLKNINLKIHKGELISICGPVGSGKSSLMLAILGEMKCIKGEVGLRSRNIAYVSQTPWIISGTFKDNILFGHPYREEWFKEVVKACCLDKDFAQFPDGEKTYITERGANLSGGQRARISLARAVYSNADIYLLDDPLSAVDAKVGKHLFKYCICGVLRKKAVLLATHLIQFVQKCDQVLVFENGKIISTGAFNKISAVSGSKFALHIKSMASMEHMTSTEFSQDNSEITDSQEFRISLAKRRTIKKISSAEDLAKKQAQVSKEETLMHGSVPVRTYVEYFKTGAGYLVLLLMLVLLVVGQGSLVMTDWWLSRWTAQDVVSQSQIENFIIFTSLGLGTMAISIVRAITFFLLCITASHGLFKKMLKAVFYSPIYFFNQNPQGRILNRFTKDVTALDEQLPQTFFDFIQRSFMIMGTLTIASMVVPYVLILMPFLLGAFLYFRATYIASSRQMKRMDAITRSPILANFNVAIDGLSTIRSYQVQKLFETEFCRVQNDNTRVYFSYSCTGRWLGVRLDVLAATFFTAVVYGALAISGWIQLTSSSLGLLISYVLQLVGLLQWTVRQSGEVENLMVSTERIIEYGSLTQEPTEEKLLFGEKEWPVQGKIRFNDLSMKYVGANDYVLKNISVEIPGGTKVGVVGRTGAGKSSFINALFRLSEPSASGAIEIDDLKTSNIPLHELRARLSIIPQEPFTFKGTLRANLDPNGRYTDEKIWDSLQLIEMKEKIMELPLKLDSELSDSGREKQLLCLARAILKKSKVLVMDEATSSVDVATDALIQEIVNDPEGVFGSSTVITIAHRLFTIVEYDLIIVLDAGRIVEIGKPSDLLLKTYEDEDAWFLKMASGAEQLRLLQELAFRHTMDNIK